MLYWYNLFLKHKSWEKMPNYISKIEYYLSGSTQLLFDSDLADIHGRAQKCAQNYELAK